MSSPQLVYIDTGVFGYRLLPHHKKVLETQKAKDFFKDIEAGIYLGVISTITELEFLALAKRLISRTANRQITHNEELTVMNDFTMFTEHLGIALYNSDLLIVNGFGNSSLFSNAKGVIEASCPYFDQQPSLWKIIGGTDALTVSLAIRLNANLIATFDRGFKGLNNPSIAPLIIPEVY